ncbi:MAG: transposase family protein [Treponema sp.]|jgi:hypothetical protein|nr:transposase family protein [Treponema sp.]
MATKRLKPPKSAKLRKRAARLERFKQSQRQLSAKERGKVMLWQIKKVLHCHFPDLQARLSSLKDPRKGTEYTIEELVMAAIVLFILNCDSRNDFNNKRKDKQFCWNYYRMFRLRLPHMDAVNDLFKKMEPDELEKIRCRLINALIEKRVLHIFRFFGTYFYIAVDGTGVYNWGDKPPEGIHNHALKKESSKGKLSYSSQVLEAVLVCKNGLTVPLMSEWIANDEPQYDKQDCESKAFKRLAVRLHKYFPRLNICILADGLYSNVSIMNICQEYGWKFITVFRDGNLPSVWEDVNSLLPLAGGAESCQQQLCDSTHWITRNYRWIKNIEYKKHCIHWIECSQETTHRKKTNEKVSNRFVFLTSMDVNVNNIVSILTAGRARWYIEDHFNTQKNRGGNLHHKFNRQNFMAIKNWHSTRQLTCMIKEFVKHTSELQQLMKEDAKMTWKELWKNLNSYLTMCMVKELIVEFEHWSKSGRQARLE